MPLSPRRYLDSEDSLLRDQLMNHSTSSGLLFIPNAHSQMQSQNQIQNQMTMNGNQNQMMPSAGSESDPLKLQQNSASNKSQLSLAADCHSDISSINNDLVSEQSGHGAKLPVSQTGTVTGPGPGPGTNPGITGHGGKMIDPLDQTSFMGSASLLGDLHDLSHIAGVQSERGEGRHSLPLSNTSSDFNFNSSLIANLNKIPSSSNSHTGNLLNQNQNFNLNDHSFGNFSNFSNQGVSASGRYGYVPGSRDTGSILGMSGNSMNQDAMDSVIRANHSGGTSDALGNLLGVNSTSDSARDASLAGGAGSGCNSRNPSGAIGIRNTGNLSQSDLSSFQSFSHQGPGKSTGTQGNDNIRQTHSQFQNNHTNSVPSQNCNNFNMSVESLDMSHGDDRSKCDLDVSQKWNRSKLSIKSGLFEDSEDEREFLIRY